MKLADLGYDVSTLPSDIWSHTTVRQPRDLTDAIWKRIQARP
jgi:hypothetical protein